jgi:hypothetical protein
MVAVGCRLDVAVMNDAGCDVSTVTLFDIVVSSMRNKLHLNTINGTDEAVGSFGKYCHAPVHA